MIDILSSAVGLSDDEEEDDDNQPATTTTARTTRIQTMAAGKAVRNALVRHAFT